MKLEQLALVFLKLHATVERHGYSNIASSIGRKNSSDKWASQSALPRVWERREKHACRENAVSLTHWHSPQCCLVAHPSLDHF